MIKIKLPEEKIQESAWQITYNLPKDSAMINTRGFIWAYLSVFGFLMYYQLEWAKSKEIYSSILIRFIAVLVISFLVLYLFLLLIQLGFNLLKRVPEINTSFILFYPMSLFHLGWYQFVSDKLIPFFSPLLYAVFVSAICFSVYQVWIKSKVQDIRTAQRLKPADLFRRVNYSFLGYLREIHSKLIHNLFYPVRFVGLMIFPSTWLIVLMQIIIIVKYSVYGVYRPVLFPVYISVTFLMPVLLIQGLRSWADRADRNFDFLG